MNERIKIFGILVFCVILAGAAFGQSGRRIERPAPIPKAESTPVPAPAARPPVKPEFEIKVISDISPDLFRIFVKPEWMQSWAIERLRNSILLETSDSGFANRSEAIKLAKNESEAFVMLLQLQLPAFSTSRAGPAIRAGEIWIDVTVYLPKSGKVKYYRRVILGEDKRVSGPIGVLGSCHTGVYGNDLILLQASIEAAESVMNSFNVPIPKTCTKINNSLFLRD